MPKVHRVIRGCVEARMRAMGTPALGDDQRVAREFVRSRPIVAHARSVSCLGIGRVCAVVAMKRFGEKEVAGRIGFGG